MSNEVFKQSQPVSVESEPQTLVPEYHLQGLFL